MTESAPAGRHDVHLDLDRARELASIGVRRTAGFMGLGLAAAEGDPKRSIALSGLIQLQFLPDPMDDKLAQQMRDEFRTWIIGCGLRELDAHFNLFLDEVWGITQIAAIHGKPVPSDYRIKDIRGETNAAKKLAKVLAALGAESQNLKRLESISNLRNCLTHAAGFVQHRHAHDGGRMKVSWLGTDLVLQEGDTRRILNDEQQPFQVGGQDAELLAVIAERQRFFDVGAAAVLTPADLAEICWFYDIEATQTHMRLVEFLKQAGLELREKEAP